ncbi:YqcC family protein [Bibersteinia trehalosi]|uniref:YqcC family protein n=1 Tax=Bibersteinia trehalosi TaxID=47735 RepID=A0A3R8LAF5_BIBTR|nr:YqcC family protein [Bibersteinia trehalosi]RRN01012.1 YqcC family protein [Bibersteinia trehalosi]
MKTQVRVQLDRLQVVLHRYQLWETEAPSTEKLASTQPFALDTLTATQWLQWIFIPRMHALLDANAELPTNFAVSPYLEESLKNECYLAELVQPIVEIEKLLK